MSVRKRKWKTSRGESRESWVVDYIDRDGNRRCETFKKKSDARARADQIGHEVLSGIHVARSASITISEAGEDWIAISLRSNLERGTIAQYRSHLDIINRHIGHTKLADLTGPSIKKLFDDLADSGVSLAMCKKLKVSLGSILKEAVANGKTTRNVAREVSIKGTERDKRKLRIGVDIPERNEIAAMLRAAEVASSAPLNTGKPIKRHLRPFFLTAVFTGMRASELRGLIWGNIDLDAGIIHVRQRADIYNEIGFVKSKAGERSIPIPALVVNALRDWQRHCPGKGMNLVFPNTRGNVQSLTNIRRRDLIPLMEMAGVVTEEGNAKYTGMHTLRHFYASALINPKDAGGQELSPKVVQERMGHATLAMTMDVYGHLFPKHEDQDAMQDWALALVDATQTQHVSEKPKKISTCP